MATMFDYIQWRGDLTFSQDPPNCVDALIFSTLSYIHYGGLVEEHPSQPVSLRDAAEYFFAQEEPEQRVRVEKDADLLQKAALSTRFGQTRIVLYRDMLIPEQETQFAAMTFLLDDGSAFIAFRGTDYSLVGWKEDFNMSFRQTVPAQLLAQDYVREVAAAYALPMRLAGHSKGGNLAVFAAARVGPILQKQILQVYNQDGPGFTDYLMGDPGYLAMVPRIRTFIPQSSVIGMLLEHEEPYTVVKSRTVSLLQHDPYSWEILGREFITVEQISEDSRFLDAAIKTWFAEMTDQERGRLVDILFTLLGSGGAETTLDLLHPRHALAYLKTLSSDDNMRRVLSGEFLSFLEAARRTRERFEEDQKQLEAGKE